MYSGDSQETDFEPSSERALWYLERKRLEDLPYRSTPKGIWPDKNVRLLRSVVRMFVRGTKLVRLHDRGVRNAMRIVRRDVDLEFSGIPREFDGYQILMLSDLHLDALPGIETEIIRIVENISADLCVVTGDFRASESGPFSQITEPLRQILDAIDCPDGKLATLGNHDSCEMVAPLERLGLRFLINEIEVVSRRGAKLSFVGLDDVNTYYTPRATEALRRRPDGFSIALVHSPEMATEAARLRYDLYLCGHTHGGQICLPGGIYVATRMYRHRKYVSGLWSCGPTIGYTSCGAGVSAEPLRYFCRGEVTLFTLRSSSEC